MKVTIIGAGHVGAMTTLRIVEEDLADVVLIDIVEGLPQGKALDTLQAGALTGHARGVTGTNTFDDTAGSDLIVMTAGVPRKPGMSRDDLLRTNAEIVGEAVTAARERSPNAIVLMVTNPLDVMCEHAYRLLGGDSRRIVGMAGVLDSTRFRAFIALELGVAPDCVHAMVLGGHGDTMVPLPRFSTVSGVPITELLDAETIHRLAERTRNGGAEIVNLMKTISAYAAPSAAIVEMVRSIVRNERRLLPVSARLSGQYGIADQYLGVPAMLGAQGVERIIELPLTDEELAALRTSAEAVREAVEGLPPRQA